MHRGTQIIYLELIIVINIVREERKRQREINECHLLSALINTISGVKAVGRREDEVVEVLMKRHAKVVPHTYFFII